MEMMALKAGHPQLWPENLSSSAAISTFPAKYGYACTHLMLQVDQPYKMWYKHVEPTFGWMVVKPQLVWLSNQRAAHVLHHFSEKLVHCLVHMRVKNGVKKGCNRPPCHFRCDLVLRARTGWCNWRGPTNEASPLEMQGHHLRSLCNLPNPAARDCANPKVQHICLST